MIGQYRKVNNDQVLIHYGVPGMKWGVRRTPSQLGNRIKRAAQAFKRGGSKVADVITPPTPAEKARTMTDIELRSALNRLQMEDQYATLVTKMNTRPPSRAKKFLSDAMGTFGKTLVTVASAKAAAAIFNRESKPKPKATENAPKAATTAKAGVTTPSSTSRNPRANRPKPSVATKWANKSNIRLRRLQTLGEISRRL